MRIFFIAIFIGKDTATIFLHVIIFLSGEFLSFVKERAKILVVKSWSNGFVVQFLGIGDDGLMVLVLAIQKGGTEKGKLLI